MSKVLVIGGGPAGMMAAYAAAEAGHKVTLYEQNSKLGKKLYITGKGRCNITNACQVEDLIDNMVHNDKFMYSSFYTFTNDQAVSFFNELGCPTKVERGNRVFPVSDKSSDVIQAMSRACRKAGVVIKLNTKVEKLAHNGDAIMGIYVDKEEIRADAVIVATGGISYEMTGATGDGYKFARQTGHGLVGREPGLVPLNVKEQWVKDLQGLSLRNVTFSLRKDDKEVYNQFGEMMMTHFGVTGPIVLTAGSFVSQQVMPLQGLIDLKPGLSEGKLDERLQKDFQKYNRKDFVNSLDDLLPKALIPVIVDLSSIDPHKKVDQITREERLKIVRLFKGLPMTLVSKRGYNEAIITQGGVDVADVDPGTMASRKLKGLYFAGEVMDLDAVTGGFNLQIAYSTGYLAGISVE